MFRYSLILFFLTLLSTQSLATDRRGRLGLGFSSQLKNDIPSISFKLQSSRSFSYGALAGFNSDDDDGGMGAGIKLYQNFFDEPQLTFYGSLLGAYLKKKTAGVEETGFQVDLTLGSEFHFQGLQSLGFSMEFGASMNKLDDFILETVGDHFVVAALHFYL